MVEFQSINFKGKLPTEILVNTLLSGTLNKYVEIQAMSCRNIEVLDFFTFVIVLNVYVNILQYDISMYFRLQNF